MFILIFRRLFATSSAVTGVSAGGGVPFPPICSPSALIVTPSAVVLLIRT